MNNITSSSHSNNNNNSVSSNSNNEDLHEWMPIITSNIIRL